MYIPRWRFCRVALGVFLLAAVFSCHPKDLQLKKAGLVFAVSPYQDTILPKFAESKGFLEVEGVDADVRIIEWGEVMTAVATGAADVAIQNFNSFQASYWGIVEKDPSADPVFVYPLFNFKGAAIVARPGASFVSFREARRTMSDSDALRAVVNQFSGRKVIATSGTEMAQLVDVAIARAALGRDSVTVLHAAPADGLNALLAGSADFYSGGVTEQLKAYSQGAKQVLSAADVGLVVIDGLVARRRFWRERPNDVLRIIKSWYRTTSYIDQDPLARGTEVIAVLNSYSSFSFTPQDYAFTWKETETFPRDNQDAYTLWFDDSSNTYWADVWRRNNATLVEAGTIPREVPFSAFIGEEVLSSWRREFSE